MNIGFPGEGFPYTNFHDMNLDWMIKIAKDFLDQYTHIQEVIDQGLEDLQTKYETLDGLLQAWYDEHSEDIANQLADALEDLNAWYTEHSEDIANALTQAISDFDQHAEAKAAETIESIPDDYTTLANKVTALEDYGMRKTGVDPTSYSNKLANVDEACIFPFTSNSGWTDLPSGVTSGIFYNDVYDTGHHCVQKVIEYSSGRTFIRVTDFYQGTALFNWVEMVDYKNPSSRITKRETLTPSTYSYYLAKINISCITGFTNTDGWLDLPTGITAGTLYNDVYDGNNHAIQTIVSYPAGKRFHRTIDYLAGTAVINWIEETDFSNPSTWITKRNTLTAASYSNLLAKVNISCIAVVQNNGWTDLPSGVTAGTFYNEVYDSGNHCIQTIVTYPAGKRFHRTTDYQLGTALVDWVEEADYTNSTDRILQRLTITPADYDNLLCKVNVSGMFQDGGSGWTDRPTGVSAGAVINFRYSGFSMQVYISYPARRMFVRTVSGAATPTNAWIEYCCNAAYYPHFEGNISPATYSSELSHVPTPLSFGINANSGWNDLPEGEELNGGIIETFRYSANYLVQTFTTYPGFRQYMRIISSYDNSVVADWMGVGSNNNAIEWYAIGDSITSGSYSNDNNEGVVASNAYWSYPNTVGRDRKCNVHNIAVPGAALVQMGTQASSVPSTANLVTITGGANDYTGNIPLGTYESSVDTDTVCGAIKGLIETVATAAPNARIVLISPFLIKRGTQATKWSYNYTGNAGFTYKELSDAMKDIAEYYNIEFINGTENGPVNILNIGSVEKDNTHPTKEFYKTISLWMADKLF